jgi:hypothetical protein
MRRSFVVLAAAAGGMVVGAGLVRVQERPVGASASTATSCPADAGDVVAGRTLATRELAPRLDALSAESFVDRSAPPGVPPAVGSSIHAPGLRTSPRQNRQQRATSAQLDAMVAHLRDDDGALSEAGEEAVADQEGDPASTAGEIQVNHARAVLQGMREGFTAATAPASDHGAARSGTNDDGRTTR